MAQNPASRERIPSMLTFIPMSSDEFDAWLPESFEDYRTEIIASGEEIAAAEQNVKLTKAGLFPDGKPATGQHFLNVFDQEVKVGMIWLREPQLEGSRAWYVYQILVEEQFRGRGYGKRTMQEMENWVRARGGTRLVLNVFGNNLVAQSLYESTGFTTQARRMFKDL
jgi:ribosomal protein S18 acetylase RimI-like enzyme